MARPNKQNREQRRLAKQISKLTGADGAPADGVFEVRSEQLTIQQTRGPLPAPETLREYDRICPGAADRIIKLAESEAAHRRDLEKSYMKLQAEDLKANRRQLRRGQYAGLAVALVGIAGGVWAMTHGAQISGSILSGSTLVALVGAFLYREHLEGKSNRGSAPDPSNKPSKGEQTAKSENLPTEIEVSQTNESADTL